MYIALAKIVKLRYKLCLYGNYLIAAIVFSYSEWLLPFVSTSIVIINYIYNIGIYTVNTHFPTVEMSPFWPASAELYSM